MVESGHRVVSFFKAVPVASVVCCAFQSNVLAQVLSLNSPKATHGLRATNGRTIFFPATPESAHDLTKAIVQTSQSGTRSNVLSAPVTLQEDCQAHAVKRSSDTFVPQCERNVDRIFVDPAPTVLKTIE